MDAALGGKATPSGLLEGKKLRDIPEETRINGD
jgi:hypothetical protein